MRGREGRGRGRDQGRGIEYGAKMSSNVRCQFLSSGGGRRGSNGRLSN